jgi:hypothetical protein
MATHLSQLNQRHIGNPIWLLTAPISVLELSQCDYFPFYCYVHCCEIAAETHKFNFHGNEVMHLQVQRVVLKIKFANFLKFTQRNIFLHMSINLFEHHQNIGDIPACTDTAQPHSSVFQQQGKCCKSNHFCIFIRDRILCNARTNGITAARTKIIRMDSLAEFRIG